MNIGLMIEVKDRMQSGQPVNLGDIQSTMGPSLGYNYRLRTVAK